MSEKLKVFYDALKANPCFSCNCCPYERVDEGTYMVKKDTHKCYKYTEFLNEYGKTRRGIGDI